MWERAKLKYWCQAGMAVTVSGVLFVGVHSFWVAHERMTHPCIISDQHRMKEMVDNSWLNRASIDKALLADDSSTKTIKDKAVAPKSAQAGPGLQAAAAQIQSKALRRILGLEGDGTYKTRRAAVSDLERHLTANDQQWLYGFLASTANIDGLSKPAQYALKDTLMVFLLTDSGTLPQTAEVLRQIYLDADQDPVIRNYSVQYLSDAVGSLPDGSQKTAIQELLLNIASNTSSSASGAAILGLNRLSEFDHSESEQQEVSQIALKVANYGTLPQMQRAFPLQVCGQRGVQAAAPIARDLAINGDHVMVRMAALATLGQLGQATDLPLLTQASTDPDERIRTAASAALVNLKTRLTQ